MSAASRQGSGFVARASVEVAECLRGEGYAIPETSSLDAFIEDYATGEIWLPYNYVETASPAEWDRLQVTCPQARRPGG